VAVCNLRRASAGRAGGATGERDGSGGGDWVGAPTGSTAGPMSAVDAVTESSDVEPMACFLMGGTGGGVEGQPQLLLFVPRLAGATGETGCVQLQLSLCDVL